MKKKQKVQCPDCQARINFKERSRVNAITAGKLLDEIAMELHRWEFELEFNGTHSGLLHRMREMSGHLDWFCSQYRPDNLVHPNVEIPGYVRNA